MWGTIASALIGARSARKTNQAASAQAARSMEFEERLSKTAHQRQVADMKKAGLNPILSATGGSGASTPSGKAAPVIDPASTATQSVASALQAKRLNQELDNLDAQEELTKEQKKAIQYGVPGKTLGTLAIDKTLEQADKVFDNKPTSSAKSITERSAMNPRSLGGIKLKTQRKIKKDKVKKQKSRMNPRSRKNWN